MVRALAPHSHCVPLGRWNLLSPDMSQSWTVLRRQRAKAHLGELGAQFRHQAGRGRETSGELLFLYGRRPKSVWQGDVQETPSR